MSQLAKQLAVITGAVIFTFIAMYLAFSATWAGQTGALMAAGVMASLTLIIGLVVLGIQSYRQRLAYQQKNKSAEAESTRQVRQIEIDLPFDDAFEVACQALDSLNGEAMPKTLTGIPGQQIIKFHTTDAQIGRIEAGVRVKTLGIQNVTDVSRIDIQLQRLDADTTRLQISSYPTNPLEVYDLARHMHYANHLALTIRDMSQPEQSDDDLFDDDDLLLDANENGQQSHR